MNEIWDPNLTDAQKKAQRAYRNWERRAWPRTALAADMDAGFDGGEFSGPAHWCDFERRGMAVERRVNGILRSGPMKLNIAERTMILEALQVQVEAIQDEIQDYGINCPEDAEQQAGIATCKANMADYQVLIAKVNNFNWSAIA